MKRAAWITPLIAAGLTVGSAWAQQAPDATPGAVKAAAGDTAEKKAKEKAAEAKKDAAKAKADASKAAVDAAAAKVDQAKAQAAAAKAEAAAKAAAAAAADDPELADDDGDDAASDVKVVKPKVDLSKTTKPNAAVKVAPANDGLPSWGDEPGNDGLPSWGDASAVPTVQPNWDAAAGPEAKVTFPWVESHGYFRVRTDLFHNFDLDTYDAANKTGSSPVLPPLTEINENGSQHPEDVNHRYKRGSDTLAGANIRLRYQPTLHIAENLRVKTTLDILDNVVLGSTPDGGPGARLSRPDVPIETFSGTQTPPEAGVNGWRDSVRVKHLWGEWKTPVGLLIAGRTMSHWGLGVLANNGNCLDCDFGDSVDRIMGVTKLFGTYLAIAWDFPSEGATGFGELENLQNQRLGQPYDLDQRDDVNEWVVALFQKPLTKEEQEHRARDLDELRKPVLDWGVYTVIRTQEFTSIDPDGSASQPPVDGADYKLRDVKAFAFIPDAWVKFEYRPRRGKSYRLEAEFVSILGVIEELPQRVSSDKVVCQDPTVDAETNIENCPEGQRYEPRRRDLFQLGYAIEFDAQIDRLHWGIRHGLATGDDTDGFGVRDKTPLDATEPGDSEVTNFRFDRDYHVDLILFREIIGAVTNAVYFKPFIGYDFIQTDDEAWGFTLATIYSFAMNPKGTPGNERPMGLEFDLELYMIEHGRFKWSVQYGLLFPFGAFDLLNSEQTAKIDEPGVAQTLQMMLGMQF